MFLCLILLALLVRLLWLGRKSFWQDEAYTLAVATQPLDHILALNWDPTPPLFYVVIHFWSEVGRSEFILRLPSALLGAICAGFTYLLGRRWASEWVGIAGGILLAIAPIHVWSSQEVRVYAAASAFGLASVWALSEAVFTGRRVAWLGWVAATLLALYSHYSTFLLFFLEIVLVVPISHRLGVLRRSRLPALVSVVGVVLLYIPWLRGAAGTFNAIVDGVVWYFNPVQEIAARLGLAITGRQLFDISALLLLPVILLFTFIGWRMIRWWQAGSFSMSSGAVLLLGGAYFVLLVISGWPRGYSIRRQMAIFLPYVLLLIAWAVSRLGRRNRLLAGLVIITLPLLIQQLAIVEWQDWRSVAKYVDEYSQAQDLILLSAPWYYEAFNYYYPGSASRVGVMPADVVQNNTGLTDGKPRVWLILCGDTYTDPGGAIPSWLDEHRNVVGQYSFPGIIVRLYGSTSGSAMP